MSTPNRALFDCDTDGEDAGFDADLGATVTFKLRQPLGITSWLLQVFNPDGFGYGIPILDNAPEASKDAPLLTLVGDTSGQSVAKTPVAGNVTTVVPATGTNSWIVRSIVNGGYANGQPDPALVHERLIATRSVINGLRKPVVTELRQFESESWAGVICDIVDAINSGSGGGGGGGSVVSVFGRAGAVVAVAGDYNSTHITNSSTVTGSTVTAALNTLKTSLLTAGPIVSVHGRTGVVVAVSGDYTSTLITNSSSVSGATVTLALNTLNTNIGALVTGVSSVHSRTGAVVAVAGDYNSTHITNSSAVAGSTVTAALNTLNTNVGALVTGVSSVFGRAGAVVAVTGDYTSTQVSNLSSVISGGASVTTALDALQGQISGAVGGVSSVFTRTGAVVAVAGDYTSTQVTNSSGVTGSTVTAALNTLNAALATAGAVSSVFSRTGAVVAALNDYTSSLVQNLSSVTGGGTTVTTALNSLQTQLTSTVSGVSAVFGRTGAVVAVSGDYTSTLVTNSSSVTGATVTAALNTLLGALATAGPITSVFGRVGVVVAVSGDYTSTLITNSSTVTGATVTAALNTLNTQVGGLVTGVSSVFARTGAVVAVAGDYTSTTVTNLSSVTGATVTAALNTLWARVTGVSSVFGRAGAVVAVAGDYTSTLVTNSSSVSGSTVTAALNTLLAALPTAGAVSSVFSRTGAVVAVSGDYNSTHITNSSTVTGATVTAALDTLKAASGVASVFTRTGAVVAVSGDYTSTLITNSSSVTGSMVTGALNTLNATYSGTRNATSTTFVLTDARGLIRLTGVAAVTIPTNAAVAFAQFTEIDLIADTTGAVTFVTTGITLRTPVPYVNTIQYAKYRLVYLGSNEWIVTQETAGGVSSFIGRTGAVVAVSGDYTSTLVTNSSSVTSGGATVTTALNSLQTQITAVAATAGVTSFIARTGAVVAVAGDYNSTHITNSSGVTGVTVTAALNTLNARVTGVSSVFTRIGAVVATLGDYGSNLITNNSSVSGTTVTGALNSLLSACGVTSVFSRTGAVVAVAGDYNSTHITNSSTVAGSTVTAAIEQLFNGPYKAVTTRSGSYTLVAADKGKLLRLTADSLITIPASTFAIGDRIDFYVEAGTSHNFVTGANVSYTAASGGKFVASIGSIYQLRYLANSGGVDFFSLVQMANTRTADEWNIHLAAVPCRGIDGGGYWEWDLASGCWSSPSYANYLTIPIGTLPIATVVTGVRVRIKPPVMGVLPTINMPRMYLRHVTSSGTQTTYGPTTDSSGSVAAYEAVHDITMTGLSITMNTGNLTLILESAGGVSLNGTKLLGVVATTG